MTGFLFRLLITALGLYAASVIVSGFHVQGTGTLIVAALVLGIVNAIVQPLVFILTLPITVLPPDNQQPEFVDGSVDVAPGEDATSLDLRALTTDPDVRAR